MLDDNFFLTYESFLLLSNDVTILNKLCIEAETFAKAFFYLSSQNKFDDLFLCYVGLSISVQCLVCSVLSVGTLMRSKLKNISPV